MSLGTCVLLASEGAVAELAAQSRTPLELRSVVILQFIPGNDLGQFDPVIVA